MKNKFKDYKSNKEYWWKDLDTIYDPQSFASGEDFFNLDNWLHKLELAGYWQGYYKGTDAEVSVGRLKKDADSLRHLVTDLFINQFLKHIKTKNEAL